MKPSDGFLNVFRADQATDSRRLSTPSSGGTAPPDEVSERRSMCEIIEELTVRGLALPPASRSLCRSVRKNATRKISASTAITPTTVPATTAGSAESSPLLPPAVRSGVAVGDAVGAAVAGVGAEVGVGAPTSTAVKSSELPVDGGVAVIGVVAMLVLAAVITAGVCGEASVATALTDPAWSKTHSTDPTPNRASSRAVTASMIATLSASVSVAMAPGNVTVMIGSETVGPRVVDSEVAGEVVGAGVVSTTDLG